MHYKNLLLDLIVSEFLPQFWSTKDGDGELPFDQEYYETLDEFDAHWVVKALQRGVVSHRFGLLHSSNNGCKVALLEYDKNKDQAEKVRVNLENAISAGVCGRRAIEFGWPAQQLGLELPGIDLGNGKEGSWAFDVVGYAPCRIKPILLSETKSSEKATQKLLRHMKALCSSPHPTIKSEVNAWKKIEAIRLHWPQTVFVTGPGGMCKTFSVERKVDSIQFDLLETDIATLAYV